jgi:hypothetical protein
MIWRMHAHVYFTTAVRRTNFLNAWNEWKAAQGTIIKELVESIDSIEGTPFIPGRPEITWHGIVYPAVADVPAGAPIPLPRPLLRLDVVFLNDQRNLDALERVRVIPTNQIVYVTASLHRCSIGTGSPPLSDGPAVYFEWGVTP